jgi:hypothetical protein
VRLRATRPPEYEKQPDGVQHVSLLFFFQHNIINTTYFENWHLQQDDERLRHPRPGEATRQISSS